jgi:hypothetical protein
MRIEDARIVLLAIALLGIGFLILGVLTPPKDVFFSCDGGSKYILTRAALTRDPAWPFLPYPGRALDPDARYFPIRDVFSVRFGHAYFSTFPVYFPILSVPGYALFGFRGLCLLPWACGVLSLWLFSRLGRLLGWSVRRRLAGVLLLGLATPLGFYSCEFWEHVPAVALVLGGVVLLFRQEGLEVRSGRLLAAGLLLGLSGFLRLEALWVGAAVLAAMALSRDVRGAGGWRRIRIPALGFGAALVLLAAANALIYGSPLGTHLFANLAGTGQSRWPVLQRLVAGASAPAVWAGLALATLAAGTIPGRYARVARLVLFATLLYPIGRMLIRETIPPLGFRSLIGALEGTPFLFLLPLANRGSQSDAPAVDRARLLGRIAALSFLAVIVSSPVDGGLQGGSRLLLPSAVIALAAVLARLAEPARPTRGERWCRVALVAALLVSIPLSSRALPHLVHRKVDVERPALAAIRGLPGDAVLVTNSAMPQGLAATYWERPMYNAWDPVTMLDLMDRLAAAGGSEALMISMPGARTPARLPIAPEEPARWLRQGQKRITAYQIDLYHRVP